MVTCGREGLGGLFLGRFLGSCNYELIHDIFIRLFRFIQHDTVRRLS